MAHVTNRLGSGSSLGLWRPQSPNSTALLSTSLVSRSTLFKLRERSLNFSIPSVKNGLPDYAWRDVCHDVKNKRNLTIDAFGIIWHAGSLRSPADADGRHVPNCRHVLCVSQEWMMGLRKESWRTFEARRIKRVCCWCWVWCSVWCCCWCSACGCVCDGSRCSSRH